MMKSGTSGDVIVKWWGVILLLAGAIFSAGIVHFRVDSNADEITDHNAGQHVQTRRDMRAMEVRAVRVEERVIHVQEDMKRLQTEQRAGFNKLEQLIKER